MSETKHEVLRKEYASKTTDTLKAELSEKRKILAHAIANERPGGDLTQLTDPAFDNKTNAERMQLVMDLNQDVAAIRAELKPRLDKDAYRAAVQDRAVEGDLSGPKSVGDASALEEIKGVLRETFGRSVPSPLSVKDHLKRALDEGAIKLDPEIKVPQNLFVGASDEERYNILNANFLQTAGWEPETLRSGRLVFDPQVRQDLLDIVPMIPTATRAYKWMKETTYTPPSDANFTRVESGRANEATLAYTEQTTNLAISSVRLPISEEMLRDEPGILGIVNGRLMHMLRQRVGKELVLGTGATNRMKGFEAFIASTQTDSTAFPGTDTDAARTRRLGTAGTNIAVHRPADASAAGTPYTTSPQETIKAVMRACEYVERNGDAMCSHVALSGPSWVALMSATDDENRFIMPQMLTAGGATGSMMFPGLGIPIVKERNLQAGRALVGDFTNYCLHAVAGGLSITIGLDGTDFSSRMRTILANADTALVVLKEQAFGFVQGIQQ